MHTDLQTGADPAARPLSDDWLYCDPEAIRGHGEPEPGEQEPAPRSLRGSRFTALLEDALLYLAGLSTGLVVVGVVVALSDLRGVDTPAAAVRAAVHDQAGDRAGRLPDNIFVAPGEGLAARPAD